VRRFEQSNKIIRSAVANHKLWIMILMSFALAVPMLAVAEDTPATSSTTVHSDQVAAYTSKGADTCIKCHDEDSEFPVFSIFKTKHAQLADSRTPFAHLQCETCHGPGANHAKNVPSDKHQAPIIAFGSTSKIAPDGRNPTSPTDQNKICLDCHRGDARIDWHASAHERGDLACVSCHKLHVDRDPVLRTASQPEVCYRCHQKQRVDFNKPSAHPVNFAQLACSNCHQPHGTSNAAQLIKPTINQTCYSCHAEKRGPVLWEHAPVAEDCTLCHSAHGSVHSALLKKDPPLLCQQCHSPSGHPAIARTADALPGGSSAASGFLLAGGCTNCHSQVHGSNSPSGHLLMR